MYYLTTSSQNAVEAVINAVTADEVKRHEGTIVIREPIELSLRDRFDRPYRVLVPRGSELFFWHVGDANYGQKNKNATYSLTSCVLHDPEHDFQLTYNSKRIGSKFVFQWLSNRPLHEAGSVPVRRALQLV